MSGTKDKQASLSDLLAVCKENAEWLWRTNDWGATEGINIVTFKSKPRYTTGEIQTVACAMSATKPEEAKCFESAWGKTTLEALANLHAELEESVGRAIEFHHGTSDLEHFEDREVCTADEIGEMNAKEAAEDDVAAANGWVDCEEST